MTSVSDPGPEVVIYGIYPLEAPERIRYVGQTVKTAWGRFREHCAAATRNNGASDYDVPVHRWIRKVGADAVGVVVLEAVDNADQLDAAEVRWIAKLRTQTSLREGGLNVSPGGGSMRGVRLSEGAKDALRRVRHSLTDAEATEVKELIWHGATMKDIAAAYGVTEGVIHGIRDNRRYLHIPWPIGPARKPDYIDRERRRRKEVMQDAAVRKKHSAALKAAWTPARKAAQSARYAAGGHPMQGKSPTREARVSAVFATHSTITAEEVREIRRLRVEEGLKYKEIRARIGEHVSLGTIGNIIRGDYYSLVQ